MSHVPDLAVPVPVVGCSECRRLEAENNALREQLANYMRACEMAAETVEALRGALDAAEAQAGNRDSRRRRIREQRRSAGVPPTGKVVRLKGWPPTEGAEG